MHQSQDVLGFIVEKWHWGKGCPHPCPLSRGGREVPCTKKGLRFLTPSLRLWSPTMVKVNIQSRCQDEWITTQLKCCSAIRNMIYSVMRPNWRVFKVLRWRDSYRNTSPHIMRRIWPALAAEQIENGHKGALQVLIQGAPWIKAWSAWKAPLCPCSIFCSSHFLLSISPWI